jgi:sugar-specific transcriptional regulator TrmB
MSEKEAIIYETLLEKDSLNILKLSHSCGINRPALYCIIPKMINKGLIIETKKGKRTEYVACSPNKLEQLAKNAQQEIESIVNNLNNEYSKKQISPKIEMYYGRQGIGRVLIDIVTTLDKGERFYRYSIRKNLNVPQPKEYVKIRDEKQIERLVIMNEEGAKRKKPKFDRLIKVLKGNYEVFNVAKMIYKNKVAFIDYENEFAFVILNERIAKMEAEVFMNLFNML